MRENNGLESSEGSVTIKAHWCISDTASQRITVKTFLAVKYYMASHIKKTGKPLKRRSSVTSDLPLKRSVAPFLNKQPGGGEPTSSGQKNSPDPNKLPSQWVLEQAATTKLLTWFGRFICGRCPMIPSLAPKDPVRWILNVDRALYLVRWQTERFVTPANVIFLYLVCREVISSNLVSKRELQAALMTCLYVSYSYAGAEISYPVMPFLGDSPKEEFWSKTLAIAGLMSAKMLRINTDPAYYAQTYGHLKADGDWERS
ncbi:cyclin-dependent kinase 5 activator 1-like [Spea bombifrons]|uniref:cyclin-dependent kinase 5 activator 1-like n=1 Tax=Spea bombifrons TaxID=233779 RepID=UPI00234B7128|nr:cyclin-dependent kinase 5 activator 1-like [Spea bombifrons]